MNSICNNSLLEHNLHLFQSRFPQLYQMVAEEIATLKNTDEDRLDLAAARNGQPTARFAGIQMHSAYDPQKEAERDIATCCPEGTYRSALVILGMGLGYHAAAAASLQPSLPLIIVEPSLHRLLTAMSVTDLTAVFSLPNLVICPGAQTPAVISLIEKQGIDSCAFLNRQNLQTHAPQFFGSLWNLIQRNKDKNATNRRTLKKFSGLWFRNMCRNTSRLATCDGITRFQNCLAGKTPAVVVAAGPTLDGQLELLRQVQHTCLIICVDTALRALLRHHITPHFIILCDPQYYNARHIEGLAAPDSILITESAAYPTVFRFPCKEIVLCSSMFPLGAYIEKQIGSKGALGTGGSVSASAWDFARWCGASEILLAGLDLGFPSKKTHTKGSTFEEKTFSASSRTAPAETALTNVLYSPLTLKKTDYTGRELLSDRRMELYAWWFESKCQEFATLPTWTTSPESLAIPGITPITEEALRRFTHPEHPFSADTMLCMPSPEEAAAQATERTSLLNAALDQLERDFTDLAAVLEKADRATGTYIRTPQDQQKVLDTLNQADRELAMSPVKELISLIFPDEEDLKKEYEAIQIPEQPAELVPWRRAMAQSHCMYTHAIAAIHTWQQELFSRR